MQPVLDAELARHGEFKDVLNRLDLESLMARLRPLVVEAGPVSPAALRTLIEAELPELDARALAYACRNLLDMVQVPPRGVWGRTGQVRTTPLDSWLGRPLARRPSLDAVVLRYLAAFGPASVADVAAWCRLTGMREVVDRLRPQLRPFRDERGRELWDLPDAARPDPDTPAPVRFLPEYDNVLLSHADRRRFQAVSSLAIDPPIKGTVLHDGLVRARLAPRDHRTATPDSSSAPSSRCRSASRPRSRPRAGASSASPSPRPTATRSGSERSTDQTGGTSGRSKSGKRTSVSRKELTAVTLPARVSRTCSAHGW